jgi:hypothetical protein
LRWGTSPFCYARVVHLVVGWARVLLLLVRLVMFARAEVVVESEGGLRKLGAGVLDAHLGLTDVLGHFMS